VEEPRLRLTFRLTTIDADAQRRDVSASGRVIFERGTMTALQLARLLFDVETLVNRQVDVFQPGVRLHIFLDDDDSKPAASPEPGGEA
jgi:hypothetical protein